MNSMPPFGFADFAESDPDRMAVIGPGDARRTAGEVLANIARIRRWLADLRQHETARLALITDNDSSVIEMYLACVGGGSSILIISADAEPGDLLGQLRQYGPDLIIVNTSADRAEALAALGLADAAGQIVGLSGVDGSQAQLDRAVAAYSDEPMDAVPGELYVTTSGTTGESKVVRFPMHDILLGAPIDNLPIPNEYNVLVGPHLTWGQMHGGPVHLMSTIIILNLGRPIVLSNEASAESILKAIEEHSVTSVVLMPWNMQLLLALPDEVLAGYDVSSLRAVFHGGAPCPRWLKQRMIDWVGPVLLETYATIETGPVTVISSTDWLARPGTVGRAVDGAGIRVVNDKGDECACGELGKVIIRTKNHQAWHDPSDVGSLDQEGWLTLAGRQPDVLTRGTRNVYPDEIENALSGCRGAAELSVVGCSGPEDVEDTIFLIVSRNGEATDEEIVAEVRRRSVEGLSHMKWPAWLLFVDRLPRGRDGKVLRRLLLKMIAGDQRDTGQWVELFTPSAVPPARSQE